MPSVLVRIVGTLSVGVVLAGCGTSSRESSPVGSVGNLGTNVCITNTTGADVTIDFHRSDTTHGAGVVRPGAMACGEGTFFIGADVSGTIADGSSDPLQFSATNPWMGAPFIEFGRPVFPFTGVCTGSGWEVGESHAMSVPTLKATATRLRDDNWKQFTLVLVAGDGSTSGDECSGPPPL